MRKVEVTLSEGLHRFVREQLDAGVFVDADALFCEALQRLRIDPTGATLTDAQKFAYVRAAIADGLDDVAAGRISTRTMDEIVAEARKRATRAAE